MLIEAFDEGDARRSIASDWENDARGSPSLDRQAFEDALFETVDLYASGIGAAEYAATPHTRISTALCTLRSQPAAHCTRASGMLLSSGACSGS